MNLLGHSSPLDVLCPMHLVLDADGMILHAGPTLQKMFPEGSPVGRNFIELFEVKRPPAFAIAKALPVTAEQKLHIQLRQEPHTSLRGILVPDGEGMGHVVVNLSFGISIVEAVRDFALTNADFAATDLAIEMLYLVEAKTAAMEASHRLNKRLEWARIAAEEQAFTDTLTGLKNRRALHTVLNRLIAARAVFAVMQIDLDYFKTINDTLGHAAGDHVLQTVARIMVEETLEQDVVARVGGDEFTVVLPDVRNEENLRKVGQRIIDRLEEPIPFEGTDCKISASIGTVWIQTGTPPSMEDLLSDADVALYASKNAGRATQTIYSPELREAANAVISPATRNRDFA
ncbi:diguanylate cyclase [Marimonas sp. MJW-29]|uniref:Diguanylate cyclase n=1 Tax=Sulfitobacter sediminis TaxID=3234186 RepID=A0ABV3RJ05_9RHOB